jgi:hypothetical protein
MDNVWSNLLGQIPLSLVLGWFMAQFFKRLDKYIDRTEQLSDRVLKLETREEMKEKLESKGNG